jgi:uncharacterized membrane protein
MAKAEHTVVVNRPPEEIFGYLTNIDNLREWQDSVLEVRKTSEGPVGAGTTFIEVRKFLGRRMESTLEVAAHEPPTRFDLKVVKGPVPFTVTHNLQPQEGGTRVDVAIEGETKGFFNKLADPLVARQGEKQLRTDFGRLKEILETRA